MVDLQSIAFFQEGPGVRKWQFREKGIKLINVKNIVDSTLITENSDKYLDPIEVEKKYTHFLVEAGDFVMAASGATWGKTAWVESKHLPLCMNTSMIRFQSIDEDILDIKYLYYYVNTPMFRRDMERLITGAAQPNFGSSHLKKIKIPLPSLKKQKKIAAILDAADRLKLKDLELVSDYNRLAYSLFLDMFGNSVTNPREWEVKRLKDLSTKICSGNTPKGGSKVYVNKGAVFLRSQNVWKNRLELDDVVYIDEATHSKMSKSSLKHKDILMTKTGRINTENSSLGRAAMFLGEDDTANVNGHVYLIRLQEDVINEFVLFILTSIEYRDYIRSVCVGGIDKRQLNKDHIENFPIVSPPRDLQNQFVEQLKLIEKQKKLAEQSLRNSKTLFNSLLQKAFKGELTAS